MTGKKGVFWLLLMLLFVLAACRPGSSEDPGDEQANSNDPSKPADTAGQVRISFAVNGWERGRYDQVIKQFHADNPDVQVRVISIEEIVGSQGLYGPEGDLTEGLLKLVQGADLMSTYFDPFMLREGYFRDMAPLLDSDPNFSRNDFFPGVIDPYILDGKLLAVPFRSGYGVVFYNKDIFDAAGMDYPQPGWTWDDMRATAEALTIRSGDRVSQWGVSLQNYGQVSMLWSMGVQPFTRNGLLFEPNFLDPAVQAGIRDYLGWYLDNGVAPVERYDETTGQVLISGDPAPSGIYGLIEEGKIAMWVDSAEALQWRRDQGTLNLGVAPYPISAKNEFTTPAQPYGNVFMISAGTTKTEAAWKLISYLTEHIDEVSANYEENALPARRSAADKSGYWEKIDPELAAALRYAADHAFAFAGYSPAFGSLESAIQMVLWEQKTLETALADAQQEAEEAVKEQIKLLDKATPVPGFTVLEPEIIAEGVKTVTFVVGGGDPNLFREVAKRFNSEQKEIVVTVREPNYFQDESFSVAVAVQDADCFQWWGILNSPVDQELILSPEPLLDADPEVGREAFFQSTLNAMTYEGRLIGLPFEAQVTLMNYNKRLFDEAKRPYPKAGWTFDDFLETAVAMTKGEDEADKIYGFVANPYEFGDVSAFAERYGADFINTEFSPPKAQFNNPETIAALRWFISLTNEYKVKPYFPINQTEVYDPADDPYSRRQALIDNGRAAIWTGDLYGIVSHSPEGEPLQQDTSWIGYVPYPVGPVGGVGFDNVTSLYILADSPNRQACWDWFKYMTADSSVYMFGVPARIAAAESQEYANRMTPERAEMLVDSVRSSVRGSDLYAFSNENGWIGLTYSWLEQAYTKALKGDMSVEQAVVEAQTKADDFVACMVAEDRFDDYEVVDECARQADPNWGQPLP